MFKAKKFLLVAITALMSVMLLAACNSGGDKASGGGEGENLP